MKQQNKNIYFLLFSLITVSCLILAGISVAERSLLGLTLSLLAAFGLVGIGFVFKKKWRKESE